MKITLVIYGLGGGGAERVVSILANYWASHGWDVTLMMLVAPTQTSFYQLDPRIQIQSLAIAGTSANLFAALKNTWRRIEILREAIIASQPDVVISFMNSVNVNTLLACWNLNIPTIVSEHTYPGSNLDVNKIWQLLMKWTYLHADFVTVLTQNALPFYPPEQGYRTIVMPNPVMIPPPQVVSERKLPTALNLIAVGRLVQIKGFDLLLQAFHQLRDKYPDWQLTILGEGSMRSTLEELRSQLQLTDRVHLPGIVTNVADSLRQADLFVMPSRIEGFPMALCEAMACGLPVLAADCLSGPREIIKDGVNGVLVQPENVDALAAALDKLMADPVQRQQLARNAPDIVHRFGIEQVMKLWAETIDRAIDRHNPSATQQTQPLASNISIQK
jgi:GalNAc-alpha-(1->4)-GalNAc-alpha-(1->3)-diNAcBac-PP-undecaprenol alpha-1,4-N-acetyl-D-galactosaminyltransferase